MLTATQLVSLHLSLFRPEKGAESPDPLFGPYISILPRQFDSHPLTWLVTRQRTSCSPHEEFLLKTLPPSATEALNKLASRFYADWNTICDYLVCARLYLINIVLMVYRPNIQRYIQIAFKRKIDS